MAIDALLILLIFVIAFVLILGEYVHRTLAAWGGALAMLIVGYSYKYIGTLYICTGFGFFFIGGILGLFNDLTFLFRLQKLAQKQSHGATDSV